MEPETENIIGLSRSAALLGLPEKTIRSWVKSGDIATERITERHFKIRKEDIVNFLLDNGFSVPPEFLSPSPVRTMVYSKDLTRTILMRTYAEGLSGWSFIIDTAADPDSFRIKTRINRPQVVVMLLTPENRGEVVRLLELLNQYPEYSGVRALFVGKDDHALRQLGRSSRIGVDFLPGEATLAVEILDRIIELLQENRIDPPGSRECRENENIGRMTANGTKTR